MKMTFAEAARHYIENIELENGRGIPTLKQAVRERLTKEGQSKRLLFR